MQTLELCGLNQYQALNESLEFHDQVQSVFPPVKSSFNVSQIISYSFGQHNTVVIINDGTAYGIGYNNESQISNSFPKPYAKQFTKIELKDNNNHPCSALSVVCGRSYTLYMITKKDGSNIKMLAYSGNDLNSQFPVILDIGDRVPIALFGGLNSSAAIDQEGSILYINDSTNYYPNKRIEPIFLPNFEKATSIVWCECFVFVLGSSGRVFSSIDKLNLSFSEVPELKGKEIVCISGRGESCIAVTKDEHVFGFGANNFGQLGLGKKVKKAYEFTEIISLRDKKIVAAYSSGKHSLFQSSEGKLFACGYNYGGGLLIEMNMYDLIKYDPFDTMVTNVSFCVVGFGCTAIFKNYIPEYISNKRVDSEKLVQRMPTCSSQEQNQDIQISCHQEVHNEQIQQIKDEYENQLKNQKEEHDEQILKQKKAHNEEMNAIKEEYEDQIKMQKDQYEDQIKRQKDEYEDKIKKQEDEYEDQIKKQQDKHDEEMKKQIEAHNEEMKIIKDQCEDQIKRQKEEYENQIKMQKDEYEDKIKMQKDEYEDKIKMQKDEYEDKIKKQEDEYEDQIKKQQEIYAEQIALKKEQKEKETIQKLQKLKSQIQILDRETVLQYEKLEKISAGNFGKVYKVSKPEIYVLKVMKVKATHDDFRRFLCEYEIINMLFHPNIIKTYGIFLGDETNPPSILLEYCLFSIEEAIKNKKFTNVEIVFYIYQIVEGMKYVHFNHVIHRDLKPSNILISSDGTIKISDFGISKLMSTDDQSMTCGIGTQKFMAPEIIDECTNYNEKVDIYSFGVLIFFIISRGEMPKIKLSDKMRGIKPPIPLSFNDFSRNLIDKCWNFDANDRPSFDEILKEMEKNNYNLVELTTSEVIEVGSMIKQHKEKIPFY